MTPPSTVVGLRPPFDPQIARALHERRDEVVTSMAPADIPGLRAAGVPLSDDEVTRHGAYRLSEHDAPGPGGHVPLVVLRPVGAVTGRHPVLLHLHGGGLVLGDLRSDVPATVDLAAATDAVVVSVGYRLAPEHPYPGAVEDAYAALVWVVAHADELDIDPGRIVVTGVSAGGGLAAALVHLARERSGPALHGQLLICPMLDDRNDSASAHQMQGVGSWDRTANATGWAAYLGAAAGGPSVTATAAAARASDLTHLPPTYVDVGSAETFRDECVAYAARLWADGGDAELHVWPGGCHAFDYLEPDATLSRDARAARERWLRRLLDR